MLEACVLPVRSNSLYVYLKLKFALWSSFIQNINIGPGSTVYKMTNQNLGTGNKSNY